MKLELVGPVCILVLQNLVYFPFSCFCLGIKAPHAGRELASPVSVDPTVGVCEGLREHPFLGSDF